MHATSQPPPSAPPAPCDCAPCEIPEFCRTSYYTGKLLTAREFSDEQRYHVDKGRLHNAALHGWGTVCGLKVKPHPHCPSLKIVVEAGLAIDSCGREVRLLEDVELDLPRPVEKPAPEEPCPSDEPRRRDKHDDEEKHERHEHETLWVCLSYCERAEQFSPAPFDECACTGTPQKPNCIRESYCLEATTKEPPGLKEIAEHNRCDCDDCRSLYKSLEQCELGPCHCIPLATIRHYRPGHDVAEGAIDNRTHRKLLPSVHKLDRVVRCLIEKLPRHRLTHISAINWTHGADLHCHEFLHRFVGKHKGFDITFDDEVRREGITRRTFQAMVVHHPGSHDQAQRMEIVPARVEILGPTHIRLGIDEEYAQRHLDNRAFDLFITLKCNVVVDCHGTPVDGDLLARLGHDGSTYYVDAPTGDGVPGGTFESWVRVLSEHRSEPR